jgi:hypothetical protein
MFYGGEPPARGLAEAAPWIAAVGARDHPVRGARRGEATGGMPPPITPGDGVVDFVGLYRMLREHGFTGPSAVESVMRLGTSKDSTSRPPGRGRSWPEPWPTSPHRPGRPVASGATPARGCPGERRGTDRIGQVRRPLAPGGGRPGWAPRCGRHRGFPNRCAAPDPEYSRDGYTRVMRLDRIPGPTAGFTRCEYVVPDDDAPALIDALFGEDPAPLRRFADARVDLAVRDLIVCTHASVDACCGTFGYPLFQALRERHGSGGQVRVWRVSSFGGHRFAPSLIDLPEGRFWGNVEVERMAEIVDRAGPVKQALDMYRGWACLRTPAEQVLERELLDRQGWEWIGRELDLTRSTGATDLPTSRSPVENPRRAPHRV